MNRFVVVTYISMLAQPPSFERFSPFTLRFRNAFTTTNWPFDVGDDPSFFSAQNLGGPITWGICRQDVRNQLKDGDIVIFFAVNFDQCCGTAEYRLSAVLTVERLIRSDQIFLDPQFQIFSQYLNLLLRPACDGWEHFEPALSRNKWHADWLWRICEHNKCRKKELFGIW